MSTHKSRKDGQQPELLAESGKSARRENSDSNNKSLTADSESKPIPVDNDVAHDWRKPFCNVERSAGNLTQKPLALTNFRIASSTISANQARHRFATSFGVAA